MRTQSAIEVGAPDAGLHRSGARVTSHERSYGPKGTAVTKPEHRPRAHREWGAWPPERLVGWAAQTGPKTAEVVSKVLLLSRDNEIRDPQLLEQLKFASSAG